MKRFKTNKVIAISQTIYNSELYFSTICSKHLLLCMFKLSSFGTGNMFLLMVVTAFHK